MNKLIIKRTISSDAEVSAADFLVSKTGISKSRVKDAMNKGALWIKRKKGGLKRLRSATASLQPGDSIEFYYDERLLSVKPPAGRCISDQKHYSIWYKPAGLMAQGTMYGDHCSLLRQAEQLLGNSRQVFPVHRLDREASGLMILAHTKEAAAKLSELFQKNLILKKYRAEVLGNPGEKGRKGSINLPLDGKSALTEYEIVSFDAASNTSVVDVIIGTGRLHQIRRHFEMIGFPVMGDPKYGKGNKNREGMKLIACALQFICPVSRKEVRFESGSV
jgi:tRNA pseudouridine32 synthase / 23S rRNA pseudouridine746 synthase